jgi:hypothetical protein
MVQARHEEDAKKAEASHQAAIQFELTPELIGGIQTQLEQTDALLTIIERSFLRQPATKDDERTFVTKTLAVRKKWHEMKNSLDQKNKGPELRDEANKLQEKILTIIDQKSINQARPGFQTEIQKKMADWGAIPTLIEATPGCTMLFDDKICTKEQLIQAVRTTFLQDPWSKTIKEQLESTVDTYV